MSNYLPTYILTYIPTYIPTQLATYQPTSVITAVFTNIIIHTDKYQQRTVAGLRSSLACVERDNNLLVHNTRVVLICTVGRFCR